MDSITQFLLGASVSAVLLGPRHGVKAALIGGALATLPDLDTLIAQENVIESVTRHRGFSHSLIVQTALSPVIALGLTKLFRRENFSYPRLLLTVWLCLITHSLLDTLTTYGTQIFWPLEAGPPAALPSIFIIDPVYTITLLIGFIAYLIFVRRRPQRASRFARGALALATVYLGLGLMGHQFVLHRAMADPALQGKKIHVQPTPFNILYWQVLAVDDRNYYAAVTSLLRRCDALEVTRYPRVASTGKLQFAGSEVALTPSIKRYEWFTDGFYTYRETDAGLMLTDLRIGFAPMFPFSFKVAEVTSSGLKLITPERRRTGGRDRLAQIGDIYDMARKVPASCQERS